MFFTDKHGDLWLEMPYRAHPDYYRPGQFRVEIHGIPYDILLVINEIYEKNGREKISAKTFIMRNGRTHHVFQWIGRLSRKDARVASRPPRNADLDYLGPYGDLKWLHNGTTE